MSTKRIPYDVFARMFNGEAYQPHRVDFDDSDLTDGWRALIDGEKIRLDDEYFADGKWTRIIKEEEAFHASDATWKHRTKRALPTSQSPPISQVGANHYARLTVQPFDLIRAMETSGNGFVDYCRGCVIKYATRKKGDLSKMAEDLEKAAHYCVEAAKEIREKLIK